MATIINVQNVEFLPSVRFSSVSETQYMDPTYSAFTTGFNPTAYPGFNGNLINILFDVPILPSQPADISYTEANISFIIQPIQEPKHLAARELIVLKFLQNFMSSIAGQEINSKQSFMIIEFNLDNGLSAKLTAHVEDGEPPKVQHYGTTECCRSSLSENQSSEEVPFSAVEAADPVMGGPLVEELASQADLSYLCSPPKRIKLEHSTVASRTSIKQDQKWKKITVVANDSFPQNLCLKTSGFRWTRRNFKIDDRDFSTYQLRDPDALIRMLTDVVSELVVG